MERFYIFNASDMTTGITGSATVSTTIFTGADTFMLDYLTYYSTSASLLVSIKENNSGYLFFQNAVVISALFGTAQLPFILPKPHRFEPNSTIEITLTDFSTSTNKYNLNFVGRKI